MNADNYNKALDRLVHYRRMAVLAEPGTTERNAYVGKLAGGTTILAIVCDKDFDEVHRDECKVYDSKYLQ